MNKAKKVAQKKRAKTKLRNAGKDSKGIKIRYKG